MPAGWRLKSFELTTSLHQASKNTIKWTLN